MMIPKYFARDHNAPRLLVQGCMVKMEKVLHLNIEVNRTI